MVMTKRNKESQMFGTDYISLKLFSSSDFSQPVFIEGVGRRLAVEVSLLLRLRPHRPAQCTCRIGYTNKMFVHLCIRYLYIVSYR